MVASLPVPTARAFLGAALALAMALPAGPSHAADDAARPDGNGCSPLMATWQSAQGEYSAMGHADLDAYNRVQNEIDRAAHFCEAGQDAEVRKIMDAAKRRALAP